MECYGYGVWCLLGGHSQPGDVDANEMQKHKKALLMELFRLSGSVKVSLLLCTLILVGGKVKIGHTHGTLDS